MAAGVEMAPRPLKPAMPHVQARDSLKGRSGLGGLKAGISLVIGFLGPWSFNPTASKLLLSPEFSRLRALGSDTGGSPSRLPRLIGIFGPDAAGPYRAGRDDLRVVRMIPGGRRKRTAIQGLPPARRPFTVSALLPDVLVFPAPDPPPSSMLAVGSAARVGYRGHAPVGFRQSSA